ncbi:hypothetical protein ACFFTN_20860 [Aminobacter aganoensis]|uniref:CopL family metal-binding regulatory protein n=1 Tax=Aminobacter aganoensis TaxID=83264 RepID=A0A7X0KNA5_9HYPH|nr:hypothetical protein [Aminobacter aganoensis]MBB6356985.1 hypothetical protein [Aminobacter aganoensis]
MSSISKIVHFHASWRLVRNFVSAIVLVLVTMLYGLPLERAAATGMNIGELPGTTAQAEAAAGHNACLPSPEHCAGETSDERGPSTHCLGDCPAWQARIELATPIRTTLRKLLPDSMPRRVANVSLLRPPIAA